MDTRIGIQRAERNGWELTYSFNGGPFCMGPEEESVVYPTRAQAVIARDKELAATNTWNRSGLADAPHTDAV